METKFKKYIPKKNQWLLILLVGILLVVISIPTNHNLSYGSYSTYEEEKNQTDNMEQKLETLLQQIEGVGEVHTMITYKEDGMVEGVVVLAEGGGNAIIARNISDVIQALFTVDSHKIKVIEKIKN